MLLFGLLAVAFVVPSAVSLALPSPDPDTDAEDVALSALELDREFPVFEDDGSPLRCLREPDAIFGDAFDCGEARLDTLAQTDPDDADRALRRALRALTMAAAEPSPVAPVYRHGSRAAVVDPDSGSFAFSVTDPPADLGRPIDGSDDSDDSDDSDGPGDGAADGGADGSEGGAADADGGGTDAADADGSEDGEQTLVVAVSGPRAGELAAPVWRALGGDELPEDVAVALRRALILEDLDVEGGGADSDEDGLLPDGGEDGRGDGDEDGLLPDSDEDGPLPGGEQFDGNPERPGPFERPLPPGEGVYSA